MLKNKNVKKILGVLLLIALLFGLTKYSLLKWGSLRIETDSTITVKGTYTMQLQNQIATYTVGFNFTDPNKDAAVSNVKTRADNFVTAMTEYGIAQTDLQTTSTNIYQREEPYYENGVQKFRKTDWSASTSISVILKNIETVDDLSSKISSLDVSDVNGPYFTLDYNSDKDVEILKLAMENVEAKARTLAQENGKLLGEIVSIIEDDAQGNALPVMNRAMGGGGGGGAQVGSSTVTKSVSVTYKLY